MTSWQEKHVYLLVVDVKRSWTGKLIAKPYAWDERLEDRVPAKAKVPSHLYRSSHENKPWRHDAGAVYRDAYEYKGQTKTTPDLVPRMRKAGEYFREPRYKCLSANKAWGR